MNVRFFAGTRAQYDSLPAPRNPLGLYFCADTKELFWADRLLTDGTRIIATESELPELNLAADGVTYFVEATRNGYVISPDRTKWIQVIQATTSNNTGDSGNTENAVKAISFAGIELEEVDGVFTIDRRCAREALGFEVPEGFEDKEIEILTKEYLEERLEKIPGADIDLSEYAKQKDLEGLATEEFVLGKFAEIATPEVPTKVSELENDANYVTAQYVADAIADQVPVSDLAKKEEVEEVKTKLEAEVLPTIKETILPTVQELAEKAATQEWVQEQGYLTEHQDLSEYAKKAALDELATAESVEELANTLENTNNQLDRVTRATEALQEAVGTLEIPTKVSELENDAGYLTEHQDLSEYAKKSELPEAELYKVDFNAPNFAAALEAYNNGKLLLLVNAAPDANGYAVMNYVRADLITFTKFLTSRSEAYGSFNTYYLHSDNTWEVSKEVRLNKVEANVADEPIAELTSLRVGKEVYKLPDLANYVTNETLEQNYITQEEIANTYVTEEHISNTYVTVQQAEDTYVTNEQVTEVVTNEVNTVVTEKIETKVTEVIENKIESGNLIVNPDAINYDTWDEE